MNIDYSPRSGGKTTRAIEWLRQNEKRLLLVFSNEEENRLKIAYPDVKNQIVDWDSYMEAKTRGQYFEECSIDNIDLILQKLVREPIKRISITEEL